MLLSSPRSRSFRTLVPTGVYAATTAAVLWAQRDAASISPLETLSVLLAMYACAAWVLWRPFRLPVADEVKEQGNVLAIRRGDVTVRVPYSEVRSIDVLKIGIAFGGKLVFSSANMLGSEIGFFLNDPPEGSGGVDPVEHIQHRLRDVAKVPSNNSLERTREG